MKETKQGFLKRKKRKAREERKVRKIRKIKEAGDRTLKGTAGIIMGCVLVVFLLAGAAGGWWNGKGLGIWGGWDSGRKEEKPLEFFGTMCHDRKGFCFDGFSIGDSYELFEKRLAITEHTRNIENPENSENIEVADIKKPESIANPEKMETPEEIEVLENPDNTGAPENIEEIQIRTYKREGEEYFSIVADVVWLDDYPGVKGSVSYQFYKGQFFEGKLWAEFPSYRAAKDYIEERMDAVSAYRDKEYEKRQEQDGITDGGWWTWETGRQGSALEGLYVDSYHTYLQFYAGEDEDYKGRVRISFGENINQNRGNWLEESAFFSSDQTTSYKNYSGSGLIGCYCRVLIEDLETLCQYSDTIVKARYVSRSEESIARTIYVFEPEEDFTGTVEEPYLHLHGAPSGRFQKGESYYLFLKTSRHSFYPHIMYAQVGSFSEREVENGEVERYSLSRKELEELPQCLREMVSKGICPPVEKRESFEEAYANTDAIYRIKVTKTSREGSFVQIGEGELLEKIRMRYKRGARMFHKKCSGFLLPIDAELGEEFFLLERYDKEEERYTIYSWDHFIYRVDSEEGRYIQAQLDAGKEEVSVLTPLPDYDPVMSAKKREATTRSWTIVDNYFACNGWEDPESTCYEQGYLEFGEPYTLVIMIKKGYPEVCEGLRRVLPEDGSWRIEECDLNYKELEKIQRQVWDDYKNMLSGTSIYSKDCAVHVSFDWNYRHVMPAIYLSIPEEYAPYIILRETCRVSAVPGGTLEERDKFIPREWYDLTCGYRLRR